MTIEVATRDVDTGKYVTTHLIVRSGSLQDIVWKDQAVAGKPQTVLATAVLLYAATQIGCIGSGINRVSQPRFAAVTLNRDRVTCPDCLRGIG
jgi:hypothetical protein